MSWTMMTLDEARALGFARGGALKLWKVLNDRGELRRDVLDALYRLRRDDRVVPALDAIRDYHQKRVSRERWRTSQFTSLEERLEQLEGYRSTTPLEDRDAWDELENAHVDDDVELVWDSQSLVSEDEEAEHEADHEMEYFETRVWEILRGAGSEGSETIEGLTNRITALGDDCESRLLVCKSAVQRLLSQQWW